MPVRAPAGFSMTGRLCWRTLSGFLSGKETSLFLAVSSHSVLNPASMCMLPQHLDPLAEIHWDTWSNKWIYIYNYIYIFMYAMLLRRPDRPGNSPGELPWGSRLGYSQTFFSRCCRKCHLHCAVERRCHFHQCSGVFYARVLLHRIRSCGAAWFNA